MGSISVSDPQDVVTPTIAMKLLENHTMEPLQKLHWLGILTGFLPFLMFTSAQNINIMARDNLSPVFYNPSKTNPSSDQMGKPEAEAQPAPDADADAYHGYRGKRSAEAATPDAAADAWYGYCGRGYGYRGYYGGYYGHPYGYGYYRGKRSAEAVAEAQLEAVAATPVAAADAYSNTVKKRLVSHFEHSIVVA